MKNSNSLKFSFACLISLFCIKIYCEEQSVSNEIWLQQNVLIDKIHLSDNQCCRGDYLIKSLISSGLPINVELIPIVKGKDIVLGIDPEISKTDKVWIEVPRSVPWVKMKTDSNFVKASTLIEYYAKQAGDYELDTIKNLPVLFPQNESITRDIKFPAISLEDTSLSDLLIKITATLKKNNLSWSLLRVGGTHDYKKEVKFDLEFPGGSLAEFLSEIVHQLDVVDDEHLHCWSVGGTSDQMGVGFSRIPRYMLDDLIFDPNNPNKDKDENSGKILIFQ